MYQLFIYKQSPMLKQVRQKAHARLQTMEKTYAKFQNNWYKTVRGVALTRGTHCLYIEGEKMTKFTMWKK